MRLTEVFATLYLLQFAVLSAAASQLEAGVAVVDITPPVGYRMSGYFHERCSTGVHDPLKAKAIVLEQGGRRAALVFVDLIGVTRGVVSDARKQATEATGIPSSNILVAATHSHTGPLYFGPLRDHWHRLAVEEKGDDPAEKADYRDELTGKIARAVEIAAGDTRPVSLMAGMLEQIGLSFNRRFHMKGGGPVRFNPGKLNPDILRPAGPIDPDLGVILARYADGKDPDAPDFSLSVFALHLDTVGGTEFSADYPYHTEKTLQQRFGNGFVSMFGTGPCGDINHIDVSHGRRQKGQEEAVRIGGAIGKTILDNIEKLRPVDAPSLAVRSAMVDVPLQEYTAEDLDAARKLLVKSTKTDVPFLERVAASKVLKLHARKTRTLPMEVQVFRLSENVAIVGLPGEIFVELGLAIKKASPFSKTMVVELANDAPAYIPTEKAFKEGSYETVNCIIAPGGGEKLVDKAVELLQELGD